LLNNSATIIIISTAYFIQESGVEIERKISGSLIR